MKADRTPQCILGNGECSKNCRLFEQSKKITNALGDAFNPRGSRRMIILADVYNPDINVTDVGLVMSSCATEKPQIGE